MIIRTISQLPEDEAPSPYDVMELSEFNEALNKYTSKKIKIENLKKYFIGDAIPDIEDRFNMTDDDGNAIDLNEIKRDIDQLKNGNMTINGEKTFTQIPKMSLVDGADYVEESDDMVPTIAKVKSLINSSGIFIDNDYRIDANPGDDSSPTRINSDRFLEWHIDHNGNDSTEWMNPAVSNQKTDIDGIKCNKSGFLTIFGWLADNGGSINPQDCWVGLYGKQNIFDESSGEYIAGKWVLLQLQPWVRGTNSNRLQYVGFNLPVAEGLRLKIRTGFNVDGTASGFQNSNSKTYALNEPNSFIGYISSQGR